MSNQASGKVINVMPYQAEAQAARPPAAPGPLRSSRRQQGPDVEDHRHAVQSADPASVPHMQTYEIEQSDG